MPREYARKLRLNTQFQQELAVLIRDGLGDPRVAGTTVTAVDVAPDLRNATVRVSSLAADDKLREAIAGLNHAAGHLRRQLGERLQLRLVPQLRFIADTALREGDRISGLIREAVADDARNARDRRD